VYSYPPRNKPSPRSKTISLSTLEQGTLIARDAHVAVLDLKKLVDSAAQRIRVAERETVGVAIGRRLGDDPLRTLRDALGTLQSPNFETAVSLAREKTQTAVDWYLRVQGT
jgi:hypothetical protein